MKGESVGMIIGVSIGVTVGAVLATLILLCFKFHRKNAKIQGSASDQRGLSLPIRLNPANSSIILSDSNVGCESSQSNKSKRNILPSLWGRTESNLLGTASGVPRYPFRDLQKATQNFTTMIGQGAFGLVYKATMVTGETVAVKVLAPNSKQGEEEFQNEVLLLGRLHHRNLVNLVGYCVEKGQHMLIYEFMINGSLASHLYDENKEVLSWERRIRIAQDVSRGIEYLHDGAVPSVVHRDIKSANVLLDNCMRARVADFGLSKEDNIDGHASDVRGTYGYLDPEYISSKTFTKKSDVYSFGVLLFELITGRNPQQGLMEYVELAAISAEGKTGWEEIVDSRLHGKCNMEEAGAMAAIAYKCVHKSRRKRPIMRNVAQALSRIGKKKHANKHEKHLSTTTLEETSEIEIEAEKTEASNSKPKNIVIVVDENSEREQQLKSSKVEQKSVHSPSNSTEARDV